MISKLKQRYSIIQIISQIILGMDLFPFIRVGVVVGVLLVSAVIVPLLIDRGGRYLILMLLPIAVVGVLILLRWPDLGLVLVVICSLVIPFSVGTGTQTGLNATFLVTLALIGLWIFKMVATRETGIKRLSRSFWPALAIILTTFISFGFGMFHWFAISGASTMAQFGGAMIFVLSAGMFIMVAYHLQHVTSLYWVLGAYIGLAGIYMLANIIPRVGGFVSEFYIPQSVNESLFWCWFGVLGFGQAAFNQKLKPWLRIVVGVLVLCAVYITWIQKRDWTSGWFPLIIAIGICLIVARPKLAFPGALGVLVMIVINSQLVSNMVMVGDNEYSMMTRLEAWRILATIVSANPFFGVGPANYYWYTLLFPILGYNVTFNSHNNYFDIVLQLGLVGLGFYLWFLWETGREIWKAIPLAPQGFEQAFLYSCFGGLGATIVAGILGDWVLPFVYNIGMAGFRVSVLAWLFLGAAVAVARWVTDAKGSAQNDSLNAENPQAQILSQIE